MPLELGSLPWNRHRTTLFDALGRDALQKVGLREWRRTVQMALIRLMHVFIADYAVLGGGGAKRVRDLPHGVRRGHNLTAFRGGARLWGVEDVPVLLSHDAPQLPAASATPDWRLL